MTINEALLSEFDQEMEKTRKTLERVPAGKGDYAPHEKSMPLGKLAPHVAQLTSFGLSVLTTPELDFSASTYKPLPFESAEQLVKVLDEEAAKVRAALAGTTDEAWQQNWKLSFEGKTIFEASRFLAYRSMFLNHVVHHRAQLGVYLRLNGIPVPATYGPSADEPFTA
ncbi:MAG TPA: DinB family protein [Terriglobia bacterium]|nr:DinB family protein [Terriglobia bacterium]